MNRKRAKSVYVPTMGNIPENVIVLYDPDKISKWMEDNSYLFTSLSPTIKSIPSPKRRRRSSLSHMGSLSPSPNRRRRGSLSPMESLSPRRGSLSPSPNRRK